MDRYDDYVLAAIRSLPNGGENFSKLKKRLSAEFRLPIPTNADLRQAYEELLARKRTDRNPKFERLLASKRIRTASGIAAIAVLTKSYPCPGHCTYCPSEKGMPKSYLSNEPAVMRAVSAGFDPYLQVWNRLRALELNGHRTDKLELIVMGGTFSHLPRAYQAGFIAECFRAANDYPRKRQVAEEPASPKSLAAEQKRNEKAAHRIIGLTLETRPDHIDASEIAEFRRLGCTRVELGVQSVYDDVLAGTDRGHSVAATVAATKLLKDAGFKINYHVMPGLPGSSVEKDLEMFRILFSDPAFQPDMLKIYPTVVLENSRLFADWKEGRYQPLSDEAFRDLVIRLKKEIIPPYVRIARLVRDVPSESIVAGPKISNLRQLVASGSGCRCIRCREVRESYSPDEKIMLDRIDYPASDGKEVFLQFVSPDKKRLFALLRLRFPENANAEHPIPALRNAAIVREVHTYGKMTGLGRKDSRSPQHIGLGRKLLAEAERIAKEELGFGRMAVISGIGAREYYRKFGYRLRDTYMFKRI